MNLNCSRNDGYELVHSQSDDRAKSLCPDILRTQREVRKVRQLIRLGPQLESWPP
jgi:hypothetical protein